MESKEIISGINGIYGKFCIPLNLRSHMFRAAAVAELILDNWKGPKINREDLIAAMLIHDLGNLIKMSFGKEEIYLLEPEDRKQVGLFSKAQKEFIAKYGSDANEANKKIAQELGANERIIFFISHSFKDGKKVCGSNDFGLKIREYADQRIGPFGILGLEERLLEAKKRYEQKKNPKFTISSNFDELINFSKEIEKQIFQNCRLKPEDINDKSAQKYIEKYKKANGEMNKAELEDGGFS